MNLFWSHKTHISKIYSVNSHIQLKETAYLKYYNVLFYDFKLTGLQKSKLL